MKTETSAYVLFALIISCAFIVLGVGLGIPPCVPKHIAGILSFAMTLVSMLLIFAYRRSIRPNIFTYRKFIFFSFLVSAISLIAYNLLFSSLVICSNNLPLGDNCLCFPFYNTSDIDRLIAEAGSKKQAIDLFGIDYMRDKIYVNKSLSSLLYTETLLIFIYILCIVSTFSFVLLLLIKLENSEDNRVEKVDVDFRKISKFVAIDRLDLAISKIKSSKIIQEDKILYDEIIMIESRYQKNKRDNNMGMLTQQDYTIEVNKIKKSLLDFLSSINNV